MKRRIYRLKWTADGWKLLFPNEGSLRVKGHTKARAERMARRYCRKEWERYGEPSQLLIFTKAGRIGKGGRYEASYGCDSKRRKG